MIKIQYALNKLDNQIIDVRSSQVKSGFNENYICLCCESPLIARKGTINIAHFAHNVEHVCILESLPPFEASIHYGETVLHYKAKEYFENFLEVYIPEKQILSIEEKNLDNITIPKTVLSFLGKNYPILKVELEKKEKNIKPDIKLLVKGINELKPEVAMNVFIEIAVTHFIDQEKYNKILDQKINVIEIDLHKFNRELVNDIDAVISELKNILNYKLINFYFPAENKIKKCIDEEYQIKLNELNIIIKNNRQALMHYAINNEEKIVDLRKVTNNFKEITCIYCEEKIIKNNTTLIHNEYSKCILLTNINYYKFIYRKKLIELIAIQYFNSVLNKPKGINLPGIMFKPLEKDLVFDNKGYPLFIDDIVVLEKFDIYTIKEINEVILKNKKVLKLVVTNKNNEIVNLYLNLIYENYSYNTHYIELLEINEFLIDIKCFNFIGAVNSMTYLEITNNILSWKNMYIKMGSKLREQLKNEYKNKAKLYR